MRPDIIAECDAWLRAGPQSVAAAKKPKAQPKPSFQPHPKPSSEKKPKGR